MAGRNGEGVLAPSAAPVAAERLSRIGALKQQLVRSDNDMAKLEDHIRGLLIKSVRPFDLHHHHGRTGASPRLPSPFRERARAVSGDSPPAQPAGAVRLPDVAVPTEGSPWAVLQVPQEANELKRQLEGAWRESERVRAQSLADKLTIEDLRQKLVDATKVDKHGSELQTKLHLATEASSDKDRMIRLLEEEVAELRKSAASRGSEPQEFQRVQLELLERQNTALQNEVDVLKRQLALTKDPDNHDEIAEAHAKLHVSKLKMDAELRAANDRIESLEAEVCALRGKDAEASTSASMLAAEKATLTAEKSSLAQQLQKTQDRAEKLKREAEMSKLAADDLRNKIIEMQHDHNLSQDKLSRARDGQTGAAEKERRDRSVGAREANGALEPSLRRLREEIEEANAQLRQITMKSLAEKARQEEKEDFLAEAFALLHEKERNVENAQREVENAQREVEMARDSALRDVATTHSESMTLRRELDNATSKLSAALEQCKDLKEELLSAKKKSCEVEKVMEEKRQVAKDLCNATAALNDMKIELASVKERSAAKVSSLKQELEKISSHTDARLGQLEKRMSPSNTPATPHGNSDSDDERSQQSGISLKRRSEQKGSFIVRLEEIEDKYEDQVNLLQKMITAQRADVLKLTEALESQGASHSAMLVNLTQSHQATVDELHRGYSDAKKLLAEKCEEYRFLEAESESQKSSLKRLEAGLQQGNTQVSHQREVIVTLEQRDAETQALMKIMKTTVESAEISMAAASEASQQQMSKISMLQRQVRTMQEAFRHFDDLSSLVQTQVVRAGREMGPLLQNSPLLKVALGADSGARLQEAMSSIASHLEALNESHAHMRNVCCDVHEGSQHKPARKDADAQDVTACEPTTTAAAALEAATAPGLLSPRKVLDPVVLLLKLQFDEIPFATSPQGKEDIRKTLQMDLARAVKIDASRLRVDMATLSSESALVSIYPDAQSPELRHSSAAVATLLVAQTRVKASRLKRGSISRLITSVMLVSDLAEYVRSVSRLVRLSSFGMAEKAEGDVQPCTLRDVFCYKDEEYTDALEHMADNDKACQNETWSRGEGSEKHGVQERMNRLLEVAQVLLGRLNLIKGLPRLGRVSYSVRGRGEGFSLSLNASRESLRSLDASRAPKQTAHVRMSPQGKPPPTAIACQSVNSSANPPPLSDSSVTPHSSGRNEQLKRLRQDLSVLRVQSNKLRASQANIQMERGAAATAPKLMLLTAKIAKLQHDASSGDNADTSSTDAQQKLAKLLEERSIMNRQHEHNLEQIAEMKDQLENLHLEHLHTETSIAQLQQQFRDRGPGNGLQGNASVTGSEHTDRRGAHMSSPYRLLDMSVLAHSLTPATARSGAKRLEEAEGQRLYDQSKGAGQENSGEYRPEYLPKYSGPVAYVRGRGGAEREDADCEGAGGSGGRDGGRRERGGGDLGSSEAHKMLHRQLWSSSTPGYTDKIPAQAPQHHPSPVWANALWSPESEKMSPPRPSSEEDTDIAAGPAGRYTILQGDKPAASHRSDDGVGQGEEVPTARVTRVYRRTSPVLSRWR